MIILDLIITPEDLDILSDIRRSDFLTDHSSITCTLNVANTAKLDTKNVSYRCYRKINDGIMKKNLLNSHLIKQLALDAVALYDQYFETLSGLLDKRAPVKFKKPFVTIPWFDPAIVEAKRLRRAFELKWHKLKTNYNRSQFRKQANLVRLF